MTGTHDRGLLAAQALHRLDEQQTCVVDAHVSTCAACRAELAELTEVEALLARVPGEAFVDVPPRGSDLVLQRTLRQVRAESVSGLGRRVVAVKP